MIEYLKENYGNRQSINESNKVELEFLKKEVDRLTKEFGEVEEAQEAGSEHETDPDDEDDYVDDLPEKMQNKIKDKKPRCSVSSEAFGDYNKKGDFTAPSYEKSEEVYNKIKTRLGQAFMFQALSPDELEIVIGAMQGVKRQPGDVVIKEGDDGDNLYVVESGTLKCTKVFSGNTEPTFLKNYQPGEAFGELALLYNAPRAATITADSECELWSLDRQTFTYIVKDSAQKKRDKYDEFLSKVKILSSMEAYERSKLADAIKEENYEVDEYVIREGDNGQTFYMLMEGTAIATKTMEPGKPPQEVFNYKSGDYFGERALVKNEPRAANIIATTPLKVVSLDRHSFKRILGPIEDILKRNMEIYDQFC